MHRAKQVEGLENEACMAEDEDEKWMHVCKLRQTRQDLAEMGEYERGDPSDWQFLPACSSTRLDSV